MLTGVSDEENPITGSHPLQKFPHLVGARETRFIDESGNWSMWERST
jgi:hypothetical protein